MPRLFALQATFRAGLGHAFTGAQVVEVGLGHVAGEPFELRRGRHHLPIGLQNTFTISNVLCPRVVEVLDGCVVVGVALLRASGCDPRLMLDGPVGEVGERPE